VGQGHADAQGQFGAILDAPAPSGSNTRARRTSAEPAALSRTLQSDAPSTPRRRLEAGLDDAAAVGQGAFDQGVEHLQHAVGVDQTAASGSPS
jgi:hypothetical protein